MNLEVGMFSGFDLFFDTEKHEGWVMHVRLLCVTRIR